MRGHIRKRGSASFEYIVDVGTAAAQRCEGCNKRFWLERKPKESCPACGGRLRETEERRRAIKAGFASRKEAQAAMAKVMVAVEERSYVAPSKLTVREYLTKEWLPAIKSTVRPTTYRSYEQHVSFHIVPHIGSLRLEKVTGATLNALYAKLASRGQARRQDAASPPGPCTTFTPVCTAPSETPCAGTASSATRSMPPTRPRSPAPAAAR